MDKKVVIGIILVILIIIGIAVGIFLFRKNDKKPTQEVTTTNIQEYYGKRGNITDTERIKFLSKNDEYLVGMIGLATSNEVKTFSNDDIIRFSLNIAVLRYSTMLDQKKTKDGVNQYIVSEETLNKIANEFFGVANVEFDKKTNQYYSTSNKAFLFSENIEKTLYYYPVTQEKKEDGSVDITVDAILVADSDTETFEKAKYEGKYLQENVDNTVKFTFNAAGKLISYQHL